jgi:hypothetical protein
MQNQIDITKLPMAELKAMAYDILAAREQADRNLQVVNQEIAKRIQSAQPLTPVQPEVEPQVEEAKITEAK